MSMNSRYLAPPNAECRHCRTPFVPKKTSSRHKGFYCSRACCQAAHAVQIVPCASCKQPFKPKERAQRCCSVRCRDQYKRSLTFNATDGTKRCARCAAWRPFADFDKHRSSLQAYCRPCGIAVARAARESTKEKRRAAGRARYAANPAAASARHRAYCAKNRKRQAELQREWRRRNPETVRLMNKARVHRQRAAGSISRATILDLRRLQREKCAICKGSMAGSRNEHLDHIVPIVAGGLSDKGNLQLLCRACNLRKHDADPIEFAQREGRLL